MIEINAAARLTFNHPAMTSFFNKSGVRVKVIGNTVFLKAGDADDHLDALEIMDRGVRGKQIIFSHENAEMIVSILSDYPVEQPYFLLAPSNHDWVRLEHHKKSTDAPRTTACVRFWMPKDGVYKTLEPTSPDLPDLNEMISRLVGSATVAHAIVRDNLESRPLGRPSRRVQDAKAVMMFCTQVMEISSEFEPFLPQLLCSQHPDMNV